LKTSPTFSGEELGFFWFEGCDFADFLLDFNFLLAPSSPSEETAGRLGGQQSLSCWDHSYQRYWGNNVHLHEHQPPFVITTCSSPYPSSARVVMVVSPRGEAVEERRMITRIVLEQQDVNFMMCIRVGRNNG